MHMSSSSEHEHDDPDPQCARCVAPRDQVARGIGGNVAVGLPAARNPSAGGTADAGRDAGAAASPTTAETVARGGGRGACRARARMIVIDASALIEALLRMPASD